MKHFAVLLVAVAACTSADDGSGDDVVAPPPEGGTLVTPAGVPMGDPTSASIGPAGGTVATADGAMTIDIPPGALAAPTTITIQPITTHIPGPIGSAVRLGPEGQEFAVPVTLTFHYDEAALRGNDPAVLMVAFQTPTGSWSHVPTAANDPIAHTISVHTVHFSDWTTGTWFNLEPLYSYVAVNNTKQLYIKWCHDTDPACPHEPEPGVIDPYCELTCDYDAGAGLDWEWAVNGVRGGDAEHGTIDGVWQESEVGVFTAPATVPTPEDVQVSATCAANDCTPRGRLIVFARIWIDTTPPYVGRVWTKKVDEVQAGQFTFTKITADVRWVYNPDKFGYEPSSGSVTATYNDDQGFCTTDWQYTGSLSADDGALTFFDHPYYAATAVLFDSVQGITTCTDTGQPEPFTWPAVSIQWWMPGPSPDERGWIMLTDGTLEESVETPEGGSVTWSFTPG